MKKRSILFMILMTLITVGIYGIYWYIKFQLELKKATKEGFGLLGHILMTLIFSVIYVIYWQYAAGKRLAKLGATDLSLIYLILVLFGVGFINPYLMQHQANDLKK
ncbi:MAG TPA: DUF4234 domain-containing protein [Clostridia bacterium]